MMGCKPRPAYPSENVAALKGIEEEDTSLMRAEVAFGQHRDSNPGPPLPERGIIPLDHAGECDDFLSPFFLPSPGYL